MRRYESKIVDETLYVEGHEGWLEVGSVEAIVDLLGGETYTLEYDDYGRAADWVRTDDQGRLAFDVVETIERMSFRDEFITQLEATSLDETDEAGHPHRTALYADVMMRIWDSKGNL
jgi:hypothetical protein